MPTITKTTKTTENGTNYNKPLKTISEDNYNYNNNNPSELHRLRVLVQDLTEENRIIKSQMHTALDSIASLEDHYAEKQMQFMDWHQSEVANIESHLKQEIQRYKGQLEISHNEVVRLTFQLADVVDKKSVLESESRDINCKLVDLESRVSQLKEENSRLSLTVVQLAKDKADSQSQMMMLEHDLETSKLKSFELKQVIENYKRDLVDIQRRAPHLQSHKKQGSNSMEVIPL